MLGSLDALLEASLVQLAEQLFDRKLQIQSVKPEGPASRQRRARLNLPGKWPKLEVPQALLDALPQHPFCEFGDRFDITEQRFGVVREGQ